MVSQTRVVLTTAGPYSAYQGRSLVERCAKAGRDYADISGEYWFQREMIDEFHSEAQRTGAKIVLGAGVDSIPSDLGTQFAIEQLEELGVSAARVKVLFTDYSGSFSGGTHKTLKAIATLAKSGRYDDDFHRDPYVLTPETEFESDGESVAGWDHLRFDRDFKKLGGPFFMAPINARIVRRSLALRKRLPCRYEEGIAAIAWLKAAWLWASRGFGYFVGHPRFPSGPSLVKGHQLGFGARASSACSSKPSQTLAIAGLKSRSKGGAIRATVRPPKCSPKLACASCWNATS